MQWYSVALIAGLIMPWLIMGKSLRAAFGAGLAYGLGVWSGTLWLTLPAMFAIMWTAHYLAGP